MPYSDTPLSAVSELIPGSQILSVLFPEMGIWPSLSGAWPTALCNAALLEHHCLALIVLCMVGLRHKMEVNTQMYLKRQTRTTYTMADEKVYYCYLQNSWQMPKFKKWCISFLLITPPNIHHLDDFKCVGKC